MMIGAIFTDIATAGQRWSRSSSVLALIPTGGGAGVTTIWWYGRRPDDIVQF